MLYRKKPEVVEAIQFTGENIDECLKFWPELEVEFFDTYPEVKILRIRNHVQYVDVNKGDYIVKDPDLGTFKSISEKDFKRIYEVFT